MAQHDYVIANGTGAAVRSDLNNALAAIVSQNSGATEPATTYAYQFWADTSAGLLKIRNAANNGWITLRELDGTLTIEDGTVSAPGLAFADDLNTGIYSPGADQLAITTNGVARLTASTTAVTSSLPVDVPLGTASAPGVAFTGDLNTGIYSPAADQLGIVTNGVERVEFGTTEVVFNDGGADVDFRIEGDTKADLFKVDAGADAVSIDGAFSVTGDATVESLNGGPLSGTRNRIINGDMRIDQRNAGASVTITTSAYTLDRWQGGASQSSKYSVQQNAGSVTPPAGFVNYLGVTSLSAYSVLSTDNFFLQQPIEGLNISDLAWGSASASTVTLSFWVRSSLTGTFGGTLVNSANNYSYPFTYTISATNTWEQKTIIVAGPTAGTWLTTDGVGIRVNFGLGCGTSNSGTAGSWASSNFTSATGATSVVGTNGATFYITGVQLEPGSVATPFERRSYGQELALCQRYFFSFGITDWFGYIPYNSDPNSKWFKDFPVQMRANPTVVFTDAGNSGTGGTLTTTPTRMAYSIANGGAAKNIASFTASAEL
jgi:hypothetical protein